MGFFEKLRSGLKKTKEAVFKQVTSLSPAIPPLTTISTTSLRSC